MQETFSSSGELAVEQNHVDKIVEENDPSGHNHEAKGLALEERCELLSEVSMEVPNVNENDTDKVLSDGNDVGKVASEGNDNGKISEENGASKEKDGAGNVNKVEKPSSRSNVAAGKTSGTAYLRRGRQRN